MIGWFGWGGKERKRELNQFWFFKNHAELKWNTFFSPQKLSLKGSFFFFIPHFGYICSEQLLILRDFSSLAFVSFCKSLTVPVSYVSSLKWKNVNGWRLLEPFGCLLIPFTQQDCQGPCLALPGALGWEDKGTETTNRPLTRPPAPCLQGIALEYNF